MILYPEGDGPDSAPNCDSHDQIEPYPSLRAAGQELALKLDRYRHNPDVVVLAIAHGGIPVGYEVARHLGAPFDLIIICRLLTPQGPTSQVCATTVAGHLVLPDELLPLPEAPSTPLDYFIADALAGLRQRDRTCRRARPPLDVTGKTVVLVDCGAKTGMTMQAAIAALRTRQPRQIIAAMPVVAPGTREALSLAADELIWLASPQPFGHAGLWYKDFARPEDDGVGELLEDVNAGDENDFR
jgi:putative phosphoribosyl transferase